MIIHLPGQPVIHEIVQIRVRSLNFDAAFALLYVLGIFPLRRRKPIFTAGLCILEIMLADLRDLFFRLGWSKNKTVELFFTRLQIRAILQDTQRHLIAGIPFGELLLLNGRWHMNSAFPLKGFLAGLPSARLLICKQKGFVLQQLDLRIVLILLIRGNRGTNHRLQLFMILCRLIHPRHVAYRKIRINTKLPLMAREILHLHPP
ncbi:hypothetical protein D3C75_642690 [compost metagenome]